MASFELKELVDSFYVNTARNMVINDIKNT